MGQQLGCLFGSRQGVTNSKDHKRKEFAAKKENTCNDEPSDNSLYTSALLDELEVPSVRRNTSSEGTARKRASKALRLGKRGDNRPLSLTVSETSVEMNTSGRSKASSGYWSLTHDDDDDEHNSKIDEGSRPTNSNQVISDESNSVHDENLVHTKEEAYDILKRVVELNKEIHNLEGLVFSKKNFAMAIVGVEGLVLSFADHSTILEIPAGAVTAEQAVLIYRPLNPDDVIYKEDDSFAPCTATIHCGPEGIQFERPVQLKFGHCAVFERNQHASLTVLRRANVDSQWGKIDARIYENWMAIETTKFSDYCAGGSKLRSTCLISALKRSHTAGMSDDVYLIIRIPGYTEDTLSMISNTNLGCDIHRETIRVNVERDVILEGESEQTVFVQKRVRLPASSIKSHLCHTSFQLTSSPQRRHGHTNISSQMASISISQTEKAPLATIIIDKGHRIEVNESIHDKFPIQETVGHTDIINFEGRERLATLAQTLNLTVTNGRQTVNQEQDLHPANANGERALANHKMTDDREGEMQESHDKSQPQTLPLL